MGDVSRAYSSTHTIYRKNTGKKAGKKKHGDVKHIVFRDGKPVMTEILKVGNDTDEKSNAKSASDPRRIRSKRSENQPRRSKEAVIAGKKNNLSARLKKAVQESLTLWNEKNGIWISYQGMAGFLVKLYSPANKLLSSNMMTKEEIVDSSIPGIFDTGWEKV